MKKIKVLMVNWNMDSGSIASIMHNIEKKNTRELDVRYCYQAGEEASKKNYRVTGWNLAKCYYAFARIVGIKYGIGTLSTFFMLRYIRKSNPDIVHIHCPNLYTINLYYLFHWLKKNDIPTIITNHAEFFYTGNCAHAFDCSGYLTGCKNCTRVFDTYHRFLVNRTSYEWKKMKKSFSGCKFVMTAVSPWEKKRIQKAVITKNLPVCLIENSVDDTIFKRKNTEELYQKLVEKYFGKIKYKKIVLQITSFFSDKKDNDKGGYYFIETAKRLPEVLFLAGGSYLLTENTVLPDNLKFLGNIKDMSLLSDYYNIADLTVLTSRGETYGMVCAESLSCGTPVVAFMSGGTESIALKEYSEFVPFGDTEALVNAVSRHIFQVKYNKDEISFKAHKKYSSKRMTEKYMKLYREILKRYYLEN